MNSQVIPPFHDFSSKSRIDLTEIIEILSLVYLLCLSKVLQKYELSKYVLSQFFIVPLSVVVYPSCQLMLEFLHELNSSSQMLTMIVCRGNTIGKSWLLMV
jgi:hypothetical protein